MLVSHEVFCDPGQSFPPLLPNSSGVDFQSFQTDPRGEKMLNDYDEVTLPTTLKLKNASAVAVRVLGVAEMNLQWVHLAC